MTHSLLFHALIFASGLVILRLITVFGFGVSRVFLLLGFGVCGICPNLPIHLIFLLPLRRVLFYACLIFIAGLPQLTCGDYWSFSTIAAFPTFPFTLKSLNQSLTFTFPSIFFSGDK